MELTAIQSRKQELSNSRAHPHESNLLDPVSFETNFSFE